MYIYSVTLHIDKTAEREWLEFMQEKHIADVLAAGYFNACSMRKLIPVVERETSTYNMQYAVDSEEKYHGYQKNAASLMQADLAERFTGKYTAERAFYRIISETRL